jgi:hypothetical protein
MQVFPCCRTETKATRHPMHGGKLPVGEEIVIAEFGKPRDWQATREEKPGYGHEPIAIRR